ncbi:MAG: D-2-hydroxyacid dehydrogenase [Planctomycetota bacterium]|jgi:phosphoglycerate dehydrogenase-like enzyme|nr:D-2-hydroxyacid dehydrogenase [Planctomycetota bacterium]
MPKPLVAVFLAHPDPGMPQLTPELWRRLPEQAPELEWRAVTTEKDFLALLPEAGVAVTWYFQPEWTGMAKNLRLLATPAAGRESIQPTPNPTFAVLHGSFHGEIIAETVVGLILAQVRGIRLALQNPDPWPRAAVTAAARPLRGSRVMLLGFGHIGKWSGRLLKPFGVDLVGVNRRDMSRPDYFTATDQVLPLSQFRNALPQINHLVLALPGTSGTDALIGHKELALLAPGSYVYNVGRGNAIVEADLAEALRLGNLAGAGLDVFAEEPLAVDSPLRQAPNVILLPHSSAMAPNYLPLFFQEFLAGVAELEW